MMVRFLFFSFCLTLNMLFANTTNSMPTIVDLLPDLAYLPSIKPAIPDNFVAMSPDGSNILDWVYWGPKEDLLAFFEDEASLRNSLIRVTVASTTQIGPDQFSQEELLTSIAPDAKIRKLKWGSYPVLEINYKKDGKLFYFAFVGLNVSHGYTLLFVLHYPENQKPNAKSLKLWNNFINNTKELSEQETLLVNGQDLQDGYTIATVKGSKLKFIAEKRKKDGKLRIAVVPLEGKTSFKLDQVTTGPMELKWKHGEPLAKVSGTINADDGLYNIEQDQTTNILIRSVDDFSSIDEQSVIYDLSFMLNKHLK